MGDQIARWLADLARQCGELDVDEADLRDIGLPLLDEPEHPSLGAYTQVHTRRWSHRVQAADAFAIVTPEYNWSYPGSLKNALDFLYREWNDKAAGFVGYGNAGGARAMEHLRGVCGELQIATVRQTVNLLLHTEWQEGVFKPAERHLRSLSTLFDQVERWGGALRAVRTGSG